MAGELITNCPSLHERPLQHDAVTFSKSVRNARQRLRMKRGFQFALIAVCCVVPVTITVSHYLFLRRISHTDLKVFGNVLRTLTTAKTESQRTAAIKQLSTAPELHHYRVTLVADHVLLFYTGSLVSHAYLAAYRNGTGDEWAVGWLRGRQWSRQWTYAPPSNGVQ